MFAGIVYVARRRDSAAPRATLLHELSVWLAGAMILLIMAVPAGDRVDIAYGRYHLPLVPLLIVWLVLEVPRTSHLRRILDAPPLKLLGIISFGVYVYHYPLMDVSQSILHAFDLSVSHHWAMFGALSLALTCTAAAVSFLMIEEPLARLERSRAVGAASSTVPPTPAT